MARPILKSLIFIGPAVGLALAGWLGTDADVRIPVHWGLDGRPDRWGGRIEAFLMLPALMIGISLLLAVLPAIDPRGRNLARSRVVLDTVRTGTLALLLLLQGVMVALGLGLIDGVGSTLVPTLTLAAIGALFIMLGNVLGKARPNWFVGIRTPWTLSSDLAWDKTHRLTGRLMVLAGAVLAAAVWFVPPDRQIWLVLVCGVGPALIGTVQSYRVWRTDPARETATPEAADSDDD